MNQEYTKSAASVPEEKQTGAESAPKEWRTADKSAWPAGPWQNEPDKVQWVDPETGLDCLIVRNHGGALCGYVGVPESHPSHGRGYNDLNVSVHGGLTFSRGCADNSREAWVAFAGRRKAWEKEAAKYPVGDSARRLRDWAGTFDNYDAWVARAQATSICHIPEAGRPDGVWWFGFDCAHLGDVCPAYDRPGHEDSYKDLAYVKGEIRNLAAQLAEVQP